MIVTVHHVGVILANQMVSVGWIVHFSRIVNVQKLLKEVTVNLRSLVDISIARITASV